METSRRSFLKACSAAGIAGALGWEGRAADPAAGEVYPGWHPGELDLHFIYTGCGENMFYRLPDGTAILNDVGEFYRPKDREKVPLLPSADRLGGEWVNRYLKRVYPEARIDYALFSHWHADHIGHADFSRPETPNAAFRFRETPDGRKLNGFLCVAEDFSFDCCMDHQYPARGTYKSHDSSMRLLAPWVEAQRKKGLRAEAFRPGALNQIALRRDPGKYRDLFSIRNICANGVLWDGAEGVVDYAAEHWKVVAPKGHTLQQNMLSMAFVMQYGKFRYYTGGDVQRHGFLRKDGSKFDYDGRIGELVGPVSLCKLNHHGCSDANGDTFLKAIRAQTYTACMWCPQQAHPQTLARLPPAADGSRPLIVPNLVCAVHKAGEAKYGYHLERLGASHVVVKVLPGGDAYRVYLLDASDESMRVLATFDRRA
ncbi:MAG: twin-arginine translocation signal domain-containing protein [Kiritimatiellia bacterium]